MKDQEYQAQLLELSNKIKEIPTSEIKYHLHLLLASLQARNTPYTCSVLKAALDFADKGFEFFSLDKTEEFIPKMQALKLSYLQLVNKAKTRTYGVLISQHLLNLGGALCALITGIIGGLIGGFSGFARGLHEQSNPFKSFFIGFVTGLCLGAAIGYRAPKKLLKEELTRQVKISLDQLGECLNHLEQPQSLSFASYEEEVLQELLQNYFNGDEEQLNTFLQSEVNYQIATLKAQFISPSLQGFLGHHAFIKINIAGKELGLEFALGNSDLQAVPQQLEIRTVPGKKIVEMIAFHKKLQENHKCDIKYITTKMQPGHNDCVSYVNKILIGTSQKPTQIKRFDGTENFIGNKISFFITNLSPFHPDTLQRPETLEHSDNLSEDSSAKIAT